MRKLTQVLSPVTEEETLAQRLENARLILHLHGYLGDALSTKIQERLARDWNLELLRKEESDAE